MREQAYPIPDNYLPAGYRCMRVYIPDEDIYQQDFLTSWEYLCSWLAWPKTGDHRARAIAAKWRFGYERTIDEIKRGISCMPTITNLRQNPITPCELQYSADNGLTWVTYADISECNSGGSGGGFGGTTNIRIENNVIVGTDACGDTVPLGETSDPRHNGAVTPAYSGDPDDGICLSATNAGEFVEQELHRWADTRISVIGWVQWVINAMQFLTTFFPEAAWTIAVWEIYDEIIEFTEDNWDDILIYSIAPELIEIFGKYYATDGTMSKSKHAALITELKTHYSGPPTTTTDDRAWFISTFIVNQLGSVGMSRIASAMGITEADCDGVDFQYLSVFEDGHGGWSLYGIPEDEDLLRTAIYNQIEKRWRDRQYTGPEGDNQYRECVIIRYSHAPFTLKRVVVNYDVEFGVTSSPHVPGARVDVLVGTTWTNDIESVLTEGDDQTLTYSGSIADVIGVRVGVRAGYDATDPFTDPGGMARIHSIAIEGQGQNPFL